MKLEAGEYTIQVTKDGFIEEFFDVKVRDDNYTQENFTISPSLENGEVRIVLTWGESPKDLDSHLDGTTDDGGNVSVDFRNKSCEEADLDVDEMNGNGPETTTIHNLKGKYIFTVVDFNNEGRMSSVKCRSKSVFAG